MNSQPVILLVGPFPPPQGGVATINELIYKECNEQPYHIIRQNFAEHKNKFQIRSVIGLLNLFSQILQIAKYFLNVLCYRNCIIHVAVSSYFGFYKSSIFILIGTLFKKKIILHLHGGAFTSFYTSSHRIIQKYIRFVFNKSNQIIVLANYWKKIIIQMIQIAPNKIAMLNNCYGSEFNQLPHSFQELENENVKESVIKILYVGALTQKKGVLDLIAISAELQKGFNQFILYIAGGEKEVGIRERINQKIQDYHVSDKIRLLGEISGRQKLDYFLKSQIFILPSYVENFPISILEAMRAGMPVVTTPVGAIPEIVEDEENGFLIQAGDIKKFAAKIIILCKNKALRESISKTNINKSLYYYSPEQYKTQLVKVYNQLINLI